MVRVSDCVYDIRCTVRPAVSNLKRWGLACIDVDTDQTRCCRVELAGQCANNVNQWRSSTSKSSTITYSRSCSGCCMPTFTVLGEVISVLDPFIPPPPPKVV